MIFENYLTCIRLFNIFFYMHNVPWEFLFSQHNGPWDFEWYFLVMQNVGWSFLMHIVIEIFYVHHVPWRFQASQFNLDYSWSSHALLYNIWLSYEPLFRERQRRHYSWNQWLHQLLSNGWYQFRLEREKCVGLHIT